MLNALGLTRHCNQAILGINHMRSNPSKDMLIYPVSGKYSLMCALRTLFFFSNLDSITSSTDADTVFSELTGSGKYLTFNKIFQDRL